MKNRDFTKLIQSLAAFVLISACSIIPQFEQQQAAKASDSYEKLSQHLAKTELGAFRSAASFEPSINDYASIIGGFEAIKIVLPSSSESDGAVKAEAGNSLSKLVDNCLELVSLLAEEHKSFGLVPASGISQPVRVGCDAATKAIIASTR